MVRERKEPRKKRRREKGRVEESPWTCPLGVGPRQRLTPRHNNRISKNDGCSRIQTTHTSCCQSKAVAKLSIGAEIILHCFNL